MEDDLLQIVTLKHPITFGKDTIEELRMRRGKLGYLKGLRISDKGVAMDDVITVAARMCGQPTNVIEKLDAEDAGEVVAAAMGFIGRCLAGGLVQSE